MRDESRESIIGTSEGCIKSSVIRRLARTEDRWVMEEVKEMKGAPWEPYLESVAPGSDSMFK